MRLHFLALSLVSCLIVLGCAPSDDGKAMTPRFLLDHGFVQSATDSALYTLKDVTVAQAADRLGFSMEDLIPGTNNPPDVDIRLVVVRDYEFALVSEPQQGFVGDALKNPQTVCTVEARLIPQLRRQKPEKRRRTIGCIRTAAKRFSFDVSDFSNAGFAASARFRRRSVSYMIVRHKTRWTFPASLGEARA